MRRGSWQQDTAGTTCQRQPRANQHYDFDTFRQRSFNNHLSHLPIISLNRRQRGRGYELSSGNLEGLLHFVRYALGRKLAIQSVIVNSECQCAKDGYRKEICQRGDSVVDASSHAGLMLLVQRPLMWSSGARHL